MKKIEFKEKNKEDRGIGWLTAILYYKSKREDEFVTGYAKTVDKYIRQQVDHGECILCSKVWWKNGPRSKSFCICTPWGNIYIKFPMEEYHSRKLSRESSCWSEPKRNLPKRVRKFMIGYSWIPEECLTLRKMPKKWIPEFDRLIEKKKKRL